MDISEIEKVKTHWIKSSDLNFQTMLNLYNSKDFDWSLFMEHLVIEKLLKAGFLNKKQQFPPLIHNLVRLVELCELEINDEENEFFSTVTNFNINARYDDY